MKCVKDAWISYVLLIKKIVLSLQLLHYTRTRNLHNVHVGNRNTLKYLKIKRKIHIFNNVKKGIKQV